MSLKNCPTLLGTSVATLMLKTNSNRSKLQLVALHLRLNATSLLDSHPDRFRPICSVLPQTTKSNSSSSSSRQTIAIERDSTTLIRGSSMRCYQVRVAQMSLCPNYLIPPTQALLRSQIASSSHKTTPISPSRKIKPSLYKISNNSSSNRQLRQCRCST